MFFGGTVLLKVFLDPGHGGDDNGAAFGEKYDYIEEDDTNLIIAFLLRSELKACGNAVAVSREEDVFVSLHDRAVDANAWHADVFVSIHCDAWHEQTTRGISTHIHPYCSKDTRALAKCIQDALLIKFPSHMNRGINENNFQVLRESRMPAVLVECEFVSNPETRKFLKEPANQLNLARTIAQGIQSYSERKA